MSQTVMEKMRDGWTLKRGKRCWTVENGKAYFFAVDQFGRLVRSAVTQPYPAFDRPSSDGEPEMSWHKEHPEELLR